MMEENKKKLSKNEATPKIEYFCNYQERCHSEVKEKLYSYGLNSTEVAELLESLVKKGLLNEQRFAIAFAGGKFRQKNWGRTKIIRELKLRQISDYCIKKAMAEIDESDYKNTIRRTAEKYITSIKSGSDFQKKQKLIKYLLNRGFEYDECQRVLNEFD